MSSSGGSQAGGISFTQLQLSESDISSNPSLNDRKFGHRLTYTPQ
nr:hypothetical protein [Kibdelosporangium sp. MJ126-NF4]